MEKTMLHELPSLTIARLSNLESPELPLHALDTRSGERSIVRVGELPIGGSELVVMAGPCSVESEDQIMETAREVREAGATILRGGTFKPRTSPYSFHGLGEPGLQLIRKAADQFDLKVVTETTSTDNVELVARYADVLQIGSRNAQNYELVVAAALTGKPILLKRGWASTIEEWLSAAEYILALGNPNVILCERGIRTPVGTVLDVNAIAEVKRRTHLPVIADPSHAAGKNELVQPLALAAIAAGADGIIVEVHNDPNHAKSDGKQAISTQNLSELIQDIAHLAPIVCRSCATRKQQTLFERM